MSRLASSPEAPLPLRRVSQGLSEWISRLGEIWVEGQVAQFTQRAGMQTCFLTLRDVDANISMQVTCSRNAVPELLAEGARVVLRARPDFYVERGTLSLRATEIRQVGLGELLARIQRLRQLLASEGLFAANHKRRIPFLPRTIGLITGRASAAERDVVQIARRRLPGAQFAIENTATQGNAAVSEIIDALERLDKRSDVDVIVIARGGGSVEDLLAFSNEALIRAVFGCRTPVVSAIGHDTNQPLLDLVADLAVSTPTDAAKQIVPDLTEELRNLDEARLRLRSVIHRRLDAEAELIAGLPQRLRRGIDSVIATRQDECRHQVSIIRAKLDLLLSVAESENQHQLARVVSLSPQAVLQRGYAVLWADNGTLITSSKQVQLEDRLHVRVASGEFDVQVKEGLNHV